MSVSKAPLTIMPERTFKRPGCDDRCTVLRAVIPGVFGRSELLLHDPDAHEEYGAWQNGATTRQGHTVITGLLSVNLSSLAVTVDGEPVHLTATELRMLIVLARRIDQTVPYGEIIRLVWDHTDPDTHLVTVMVSRLREKLGLAESLITTIVSIGLRLDSVPPGEIRQRARPRLDRGKWAACAECCARCGTTNVKHWAHGFCSDWKCRRAYRNGWRPGVQS